MHGAFELVAFVQGIGPEIEGVGLEAGPLPSWLHEGLAAADWPVVCVEARHMQAALSAMHKKTDRNDARGIAQMMRTGWFRRVHIKSLAARELRLVVNRDALLARRRDIEKTIRGALKVFGLKVGAVGQRGFEERVLTLVAGSATLVVLVQPMLTVRQVLIEQHEILRRRLLKMVRKDETCRPLMTVPRVGSVVAAVYRTGVDVPERFVRSHSVGAHFGMTPRRYASGGVHLSQGPQNQDPSTDEMDKRFWPRGGRISPARATSWRSAAHRLEAPPGRLIRALPV